ncbi:MAG: hypothetical protein WB788_07465 [Thermoplasmata archaeon]
MGEFLVDGKLEVAQRGSAQTVHVQQQVMEVEPFRSVGWARDVPRERSVSVDRLGVVLVIGPVEFPPGWSDQRRIEMIDRIVCLDQRSGGTRRFRPDSQISSLQVRVHGPLRVLQFSDRTARHVLDNGLQAPTRPAARRAGDRCLRAHVLSPAHGPL